MTGRKKIQELACVLAAVCLAFPVSAADIDFRTPATDDDLRDNLLTASLLQNLDEDGRNDNQLIISSAQADYARLIAVLYGAGHFAPAINILVDGQEAANIPPVAAPRTIRRVVIAIAPGPVFQFGTARISPTAAGTPIPDGFATGSRADLGVLKETASAATDRWRELGHAKARISDQKITARHGTNQLDAVISMGPGPKLTFGQLVIRGNEDVRTARIRDIADLPTGQTFSPKIVETVATRLRRTGAFRTVSITEGTNIGPGDTLDLNIELVEQTPRRFGFGAEISSLEGFSASAFWLHRNLLGGAERLRFDAEISGVGGNSGGTDYRLATRFERPATFNTDTNFFAQTSVERLDEVLFRADTFNAEIGITRIANPKRTYEFGIGVLASNTQDDFGSREFRLATMPISVNFDYRNKKLDPTSGYYANVELTPFIGLAGSESGLRAYGDLRAYYTVGDTRPVTFAARVQAGSVVGPDVDEAFPDYLFYSGGGGTVRGQPYQSLGVNLPTGQRVGGKSFLGLSGEARFKITDAIGLVGFVDGGFIGETDVGDGNLGAWHTGAGLGLRYETGIGPIRLDLALPISGPGENSGFEVYIGIGQAF